MKLFSIVFMICVIDYGLGNTGSILNMFGYLGIETVISSNPEIIHYSSHLVLPGVGSFDQGIKNLKERNLVEVLNNEVIDAKKPILGICLGAQMMTNSSLEGNLPGLAWIHGTCMKFDPTLGIKIPHMGWSQLNRINDNLLFQDLPYYPPRFYFVHTYYFNITNESEVASTTVYGLEFASSFRRDNIFGVQFHPEKSHRFGMKVLLNFAKVT